MMYDILCDVMSYSLLYPGDGRLAGRKKGAKQMIINVLCYGDSNTYGYIPGAGGRYPRDVRYSESGTVYS